MSLNRGFRSTDVAYCLDALHGVCVCVCGCVCVCVCGVCVWCVWVFDFT